MWQQRKNLGAFSCSRWSWEIFVHGKCNFRAQSTLVVSAFGRFLRVARALGWFFDHICIYTCMLQMLQNGDSGHVPLCPFPLSTSICAVFISIAIAIVFSFGGAREFLPRLLWKMHLGKHLEEGRPNSAIHRRVLVVLSSFILCK